jgi:hypothetical protein
VDVLRTLPFPPVFEVVRPKMARMALRITLRSEFGHRSGITGATMSSRVRWMDSEYVHRVVNVSKTDYTIL